MFIKINEYRYLSMLLCALLCASGMVNAQSQSETGVVQGSETSVSRIFGIGQETDNRAQLSKSVATANLSLGARFLLGTMEHAKDDDRFVVSGDHNILPGASLDLKTALTNSQGDSSSSWRLGAFATVAYFSGEADVQRSGVENYEYAVTYHVVPLKVGMQWDYYVTPFSQPSQWGLRVGAEAALINQIGDGELDTTSSIRYAETVGFMYSILFASWTPFLALDWAGPLSRGPSTAAVVSIGMQSKLL